MGFLLLLLLLAAAWLLFTLPPRLASLPLIAGAAYIGCFFQIEIGPAHFTASRILVGVGLLRVMVKGERIAGGFNSLDRLMIAWALWNACSSFFHVAGALMFRLGMVLDTVGVYFLFRVFLRDAEDVRAIYKIVCIVLVPLGAAMMFEKITGRNCFEMLGGAPGAAELRNGHFRARGPFIHQILGGSVGAVCFPMALALWRQEPNVALAGLAGAICVVVASGSSGPVMIALSVFLAMGLWKVRGQLRRLRWLAVLLIIALDIVMNDPVYYLMARIDITGGSTGWHRAALIDSAIKHFDTWWFAGTDYTRDWMPTGIQANETNSDITNHFLAMGVWGGMPLMLLFIWVLGVAFAAVGRALRSESKTDDQRFLIWTLGATLFGHVTAFLSISYFDTQSVVFLYLVLAAIGSLCFVCREEGTVPVPTKQGAVDPVAEPSVGYE
jgi:hypothetical protein